MPNVSSTIRKQLNLPTFNVMNDKLSHQIDSNNIKPTQYEHPILHSRFMCFLKEGHKMGKSEPLFKRITEDQVKELKVRFGGVQEKTEIVEEVIKPVKSKSAAKVNFKK